MEMECGWQNNGPRKDVHVLYLQMFDYVTFTWHKRLWRCDVIGSWDGKIILDYLDRLNLIT